MPQQLTVFGRIVWGHPGVAKAKKDDNKQPVLKDGQPVMQWSFGLAVEKATTMQARGCTQEQIAAQSFEYAVWPFFDAEAKTGFPNGVPGDFSWKWRDGDSMDRQGKPYSAREGYAGHYVIAISTEAFAPPLYRQVGNTYQVIDPKELKTGDYVSASLTLKLNIPQNRNHKPGIYVNPNGVCFAGYGTAIISGPDAETMFGQQSQFALPPGASTQPMAPAGAPMMPGQAPMAGAPMMPGQGMPQQAPMQSGMPGQGMPGQMPMGAPQQPQQAPMGGAPAMPGQIPMGAPQQMPPPAHGFVAGAGMPGQMPVGAPQQPMPGGAPMMPGQGIPGR